MARAWVAASLMLPLYVRRAPPGTSLRLGENALRAVARGIAHLSRGTMLRLRVVSEQRRSLAERGSAIFSVEGGTIGRSADNDWILPDPQRYISAHHARISFREGQFVIEDTSTNGVFINDDERPLRELGPYRLASGDVLRLGEYQVVAALEAETAAASGDAARGTSSRVAGYANTDA